MRRLIYTVLSATVLFAVMSAPAAAQTPPTIRILGVGQVGMDVPTPTLAEASAQKYRAYVNNATVGTVVTATCTGTVSPFLCAWPLSAITAQLVATAARPLSVTAAVTAADGEKESAKVVAPFVLQLAGNPVAPTAASISITP